MVQYPKYISKINSIEIKNLWGKYDIEWKLDPKVNILGGINGSGKTTILRIIDNIFNEPHFPHEHDYDEHKDIHLPDKNDFRRKMKFREYGTEVKIIFNDDKEITGSGDYWAIGMIDAPNKIRSLVNTFDAPIKDIDKVTETNTPIDIELETLIDGNLYEFNFVKLDSKIQSKTIELYKANKRQEADKEERRVQDFFNLIDSFFQKTNKRIQFTEDKNIVFQNGSSQLKTNQLSGGEKQLLIILFQVFLQEGKPRVLLLDEPEISLHLRWQFKLIETIRSINPNCQLIVATHSPSIFGKGWGDKVVDIETLKTPV